MLNYDLHLQITRDGMLNRRTFVRSAAAGGTIACSINGMGGLLAETEQLRKSGMACILLFMQGGPSQFETFDPKPGTDTGGPTQAIDTVLPGVKIAEHWPKVAKQLKDIAIIRSVTGKENDHQRAIHLLHTGYAVNASVKYPGLGAVVASENGDRSSDFPGFVSIGQGNTIGPGFLGSRFAPLAVQDPEELPRHLELPPGLNANDLNRRLKLLDQMEQDFAKSSGKSLVTNHRAIYETASKLVMSPKLEVFDLTKEDKRTRDRYGRSAFGQGCLLARRLIEKGVTFVEVNSGGTSTATNWDTHRDNFAGHQRLSGPVDTGWTTLIEDLKERGMLEKTLVICMGEFGRTPTINGNAGRDHFARAFSVAVAGGGVRGGQVIGSTDDTGNDVATRPVTVSDLFCSFYHALKIDPREQNDSNGRPIFLVDGGEPVMELFS